MTLPGPRYAAVSVLVSLMSWPAFAAQAQEAQEAQEKPAQESGQELVKQNSDGAKGVQMTPARIADAVEDELSHDAMASLADVDVRVKNGIATLSGTVDSLLARERAGRIARTVKGVTIVLNEITVRPRLQMEADELRSTIHQALLTSPATESFEIEVSAEPDGSVRLGGNVESWAERNLAGRIAKGVSGVTAVENYIEVDYTRNRLDTEVAAEVERLLEWDLYLDDTDVDVTVKDGAVSLSGTVKSAAEKDRAINLAWLAGSQSVRIDDLKVVSNQDSDGSRKQRPADVSDEAIAAAVRNRLEVNPYVESGNVQVEVDNGATTLRGEVDNLKAKRAAGSAASEVYAVDRVRNRLDIRAPAVGGPNERQLESRIVGALATNPVTESYEIDVSVTGGTVDLAGNVDSWFEKGTADDVVAGIRGVRKINNRLRVLNTHDNLTFDPYVDEWSVYAHDWYQPDRSTVWALDATVRADVEDELWWSPFVDASDVQVSVLNGVVTLTGSVDSAAESRAAQENAFEGGAAGVVNRLRIEG